LRDPLLFREHGIRIQGSGHVALQRFHNPASPSLPRVPVRRVPLARRYYETLRHPAAPPAALRYPSLGGPTPSPCIRLSPLPACPTPACGPGAVAVWPPHASCFQEWKRQDFPSSWGTLVCLRPALRPRRDRHVRPSRRTGTTPVDLNTKATRDQNTFGAPSHGL